MKNTICKQTRKHKAQYFSAMPMFYIWLNANNEQTDRPGGVAST